MTRKIKFHVKFHNFPHELWTRDSFDAFWHDLHTHMLKHGLSLEWIIRNED